MNSLFFAQVGGALSWGLFIFAFGACVGSLTNVLVYRLPLGLDVVTSPSRCPQCGNRLTWRENIPVLGWLMLRGRCRFCRSRISPEYPMVEAFVGLLFLCVFVLWYQLPADATWLGVEWGNARPKWAMIDHFDGFPRHSWGPFTAVIMLFGALTAMTLVDFKTCTIPLQIPWFATVVAILFHTAGAAIEGPLPAHFRSPLSSWTIPLPGGGEADPHSIWSGIGATFGGVLGLGVSLVLLHFGLIRRSFDDYAEWEAKALADQAGTSGALGTPSDAATVHPEPTGYQGILPNAASQPTLNTAGPVGEQSGDGAWLTLRFLIWTIASLVALASAGVALARTSQGLPQWCGLVMGGVVAPMIGAVAIRGRVRRAEAAAPKLGTDPASTGSEASQSPTAMWIQYPHARREMFKELLFLTPCMGLTWLGGWAFAHVSWPVNRQMFWLVVLAGVLMGYLIGGGLVWGVRIAGSLAFGKEAIGLGDVHLMAAVGACVGWIDAVLAFPLAAMVGLYCTIVGWIITGRVGRAMSFGPYLAGATLIVVLGIRLVDVGLSWLYGKPIDLP